ncbi:hypothetical protein [Aquimarina megaterium]|uniref:hypothetical protein n=1 Tax=Aquimarina megaterium TaxID=1443666 RepID=UPI0009430073|nr:hypothetical protein [Aquimarina megaterium]
MSFDWPHHPLYDKLSEKASLLLPKIGFEKIKSRDGQTLFISKEKVLITIQHGGYDMPYIYIGNKKNTKLLSPNCILEYYLNKSTPIFRKYSELKSFYDFEYEYEFLKEYVDEILNILEFPKSYLEWEKTRDYETILELIRNQNN